MLVREPAVKSSRVRHVGDVEQSVKNISKAVF